MAEMVQPDVVGNYLAAYTGAQDRRAKEADRQRTMQRQDVADQQQAQQFEANSQLGRLNLHKAKVSALNELLAAVPDGNLQAFEQAKQQALAHPELGLKPEDVANLTVADLPRLRMETGKAAQMLDMELKRAQIGSAKANTAKSYAAATASRVAAAGGEGTGAEFDPEDPYAGLSPKARERLILQNSKEYATTATQNDKEVQGARQVLIDANRFAQLSNEVNAPGGSLLGTGSLAGLPGVRQAQGALDSRYGEMEAITARLVPKLREPGSGATSDFDANMFQRGTIGVDKQGKTNEAIVIGMKEAAKNLIEKARFEESFFKARKTLVGSQDAWQSYLEANPIFDESSADLPKLNKNRVSWKQFFDIRAPASQQSGQRAAAFPGAPPIGTVEDGMRFKGGDPKSPASWAKVQ